MPDVHRQYWNHLVRIRNIIEYSFEYPYGRPAIIWLRSENAFYRIDSVSPAYLDTWRPVQEAATIAGHVVNTLLNVPKTLKCNTIVGKIAGLALLDPAAVVEQLTRHRDFIIHEIKAQRSRRIRQSKLFQNLATSHSWSVFCNDARSPSASHSSIGQPAEADGPLEGLVEVCLNSENEENSSEGTEASRNSLYLPDSELWTSTGSPKSICHQPNHRSLSTLEIMLSDDDEYSSGPNCPPQPAPALTIISRPPSPGLSKLDESLPSTKPKARLSPNVALLSTETLEFMLPSTLDDTVSCPLCGITLFKDGPISVVARLLFHMEAFHLNPTTISVEALPVDCHGEDNFTFLKWPSHGIIRHELNSRDLFLRPTSLRASLRIDRSPTLVRPFEISTTEHVSTPPIDQGTDVSGSKSGNSLKSERGKMSCAERVIAEKDITKDGMSPNTKPIAEYKPAQVAPAISITNDVTEMLDNPTFSENNIGKPTELATDIPTIAKVDFEPAPIESSDETRGLVPKSSHDVAETLGTLRPHSPTTIVDSPLLDVAPMSLLLPKKSREGTPSKVPEPTEPQTDAIAFSLQTCNVEGPKIKQISETAKTTMWLPTGPWIFESSQPTNNRKPKQRFIDFMNRVRIPKLASDSSTLSGMITNARSDVENPVEDRGSEFEHQGTFGPIRRVSVESPPILTAQQVSPNWMKIPFPVQPPKRSNIDNVQAEHPTINCKSATAPLTGENKRPRRAGEHFAFQPLSQPSMNLINRDRLANETPLKKDFPISIVSNDRDKMPFSHVHKASHGNLTAAPWYKCTMNLETSSVPEAQMENVIRPLTRVTVIEDFCWRCGAALSCSTHGCQRCGAVQV